MIGDCHGKVAIVTGGSRGIGRATAIRMVRAGAKVAIVARDMDETRHGRSLASTAAELGEDGLAIVADLADPALDHGAIVARVEATLGPVDILVNNAAMGGFRPFMDYDLAALMAMQQVNVWAPWMLARSVLPGMRARGRGAIVNVSSGAALVGSGGLAGSAAYGGTKAMLNRWTYALAAEHADLPIMIGCIAPQGAAGTEHVDGLVRDGHLAAGIVEPVSAMSEAILALATAAPVVRGGSFRRSLELLRSVGRPVIHYSDGTIVPGYDMCDLDARLAAFGIAGTGKSRADDPET